VEFVLGCELDIEAVQRLTVKLRKKRGTNGINFGRYATTHDGEIEKLFPFAHVILPRWVDRSLHERLRLNQDKLVTPFDLYRVSQSLLHYPNPAPPFDQRHRDTKNPPLPGVDVSHIMASFQKPITPIDLTRELASYNRTCLEANIPVEFCTCLPFSPLRDGRDLWVQRALAAHRHRVSEYQGKGVCSEVELHETIKVEVQKWPTEYKPELKTTAKRMWAMPKRDVVRVQYSTTSGATFTTVMSVSQTNASQFDVSLQRRVDSITKKCGVTDKVLEQLCVCKP